ncbi:MAG TPA: bifunctional phosphopantothenoylcysteine decarboxylase/phosphopantothenate--cysteine ligase CoaBC [Anaerolineae bacterium]|nr:bifunctional phosphopantothenoylcysteine decarboxylase/phosphopantothenate--cysteine ligase CoaBC [Anaerolineae bacterium]
MILQGANIVLGVTGGIACYKAIDLCSKMVQAGASVDVIMTDAATHFLTPLPFQTISRRPVSADMFRLLRDTDVSSCGSAAMAHVALSERAGVILIAPATANTIAKLAHGLADNLLTCTVLATRAPLVIAPAMNADMWASEITQGNVRLLQERGATIVGPGYGRLASGRVGAGRLADADKILGAVRQALGRDGHLAGVRVAVTAGGTQEPLDPVRHLGNRSSGRMGYALAEAARDCGAQVRLINAPTSLKPLYGVEMIPVRTAGEMYDQVMGCLDDTDILIMAAAVADYRPTRAASQKLKKSEGTFALELERTQDILAAVADARSANKPRLVVGFAAETENLLANARIKLRDKRVDLLVANDVSSADSGFGVATNRVTLLTPDGDTEALPLMPKVDIAERVLERVATLWRACAPELRDTCHE